MTVMCTNMNPRTGGFTFVMDKSMALDGALGKIPHLVRPITMVRQYIS